MSRKRRLPEHNRMHWSCSAWARRSAKAGWWVVQSTFRPVRAHADLSVPISGPKGKGTVYVKALKSAGAWAYNSMVATVDGSSEKIDLLANATATVPESNPPTLAPQPVADAQ